MAVYTVLNFEQAEEIVKKYNIGELTDLKGISKGIMNSNYYIFTDKGKYVMRILEGQRNIEEEKKELKYLEHLCKNGIMCPEVLLTSDGEDHIMFKGKMVSIFGFLEGEEVKNITNDMIEEFGEILAKMHNLSVGRKLKREEGIELGFLYGSVSKDLEKLKSVLGEYYSVVDEKLKKVTSVNFTVLPSGIIHNDIFPDNVFTKNGKITGIIDFNDAISAAFLHDIAIVLNFWIFNVFKQYKKDTVDAFFRGYEKNRKITSDEKKALPDALDKVALTFLFLRIKKFNFDAGEGVQREFKDFRDLLPMVMADKNIIF